MDVGRSYVWKNVNVLKFNYDLSCIHEKISKNII